jgi:hypothetical protein
MSDNPDVGHIGHSVARNKSVGIRKPALIYENLSWVAQRALSPALIYDCFDNMR